MVLMEELDEDQTLQDTTKSILAGLAACVFNNAADEAFGELDDAVPRFQLHD